MFSRSRKHIYFKFGRCEKLEDRNMLAAHMFAAFPIAGHFIPLPVAAIHGGHQAGVSAGHSDNGGGNYSSSQQTTFTADAHRSQQHRSHRNSHLHDQHDVRHDDIVVVRQRDRRRRQHVAERDRRHNGCWHIDDRRQWRRHVGGLQRPAHGRRRNRRQCRNVGRKFCRINPQRRLRQHGKQHVHRQPRRSQQHFGDRHRDVHVEQRITPRKTLPWRSV